MNENLPFVRAEVTFLTTDEGGRRNAPILCYEYRPHIVIQSPDARQAIVDQDGVRREAYLGVCFDNPSQDCQLGHSVEVDLELMYHPRVDYSEVLPGRTFTIREGGSIVGYGKVISRNDSM